MNRQKVSAILSNEKFKKLICLRGMLRYSLGLLILATHAFFVGGIAFYSEWFAQPLYAGSSIPLGIFFTVLVIVIMLILEAIYILVSDHIFDPMQQEIYAEITADE